MIVDSRSFSPDESLDIPFREFEGWMPINDTIMGGCSSGSCCISNEGLVLEGVLVEEGGGFVSCSSSILSPSINLSRFSGLELDIDGCGLTLKLALACQFKSFSFGGLIGEGLRWVAEIPTERSGTTTIRLPFKIFKPTIRANPIRLPLMLDASRIIQFQLLFSKFGIEGGRNMGFRSGSIKVLLRSIRAFH